MRDDDVSEGTDEPWEKKKGGKKGGKKKLGKGAKIAYQEPKQWD